MCFLAEYILLNTHLRLLQKYVGPIHRSIETVRGPMFLFYFIVLVVIVHYCLVCLLQQCMFIVRGLAFLIPLYFDLPDGRQLI